MSEEKLNSKWSLKVPMLIDKTDDRYEDQLKQLKEDGFSDTETWSLYTTIAEFVLPRLKRFKETTMGCPLGFEEEDFDEWYEILDKMIFAFEWALEDGEMSDRYINLSKEEKEVYWGKYKEGMGLFSEYFMGLWW